MIVRTALAAADGPSPEELGEWIAHGFSPAQARGWIADGAALGEAETWRAIGLAQAEDALRWRVRGVGPGEARLLESAGLRTFRSRRRRRLAGA